LVTANTVTLISDTFGRLTGGKNTENWKTQNVTKSRNLGAPVETPVTDIGSNLARENMPAVYCFTPNSSMIGAQSRTWQQKIDAKAAIFIKFLTLGGFDTHPFLRRIS